MAPHVAVPVARRTHPRPHRLPGTRAWLTADNAGYGIYPLLGLDSQASSVLTERILQRHSGAH